MRRREGSPRQRRAGTSTAPPLPPTSGFAPLGDYGAIGDLHTVALVSRGGSIDWACFPRFDSPSVFGALLDPEKGGSAGVLPLEGGRSVQDYVPSTNILETRYRLSEGRTLFITDFMPAPAGRGPLARSHILRILEAIGGPVPVQIWIHPRFQYGRSDGRWSRRSPIRWLARAGDDRLHVQLPPGATASGGRLEVRPTVMPEEPQVVDLAWGGPPLTSASPFRRLVRTEAYWRDWVHRSDAPLHRIAGRWHMAIERSELLLKLLSNARTGAFVAAPTTSLPEWPGGRRNWDYRFVWIRDAAFTAQAMILLGHRSEARAYLRWVIDRLRAAGPKGELRVVYPAIGDTDLKERELPHLRGYRDSRPVRIGNGAHTQFQLDIYGEVLDCALLLLRAGDRPFVRQRWGELRKLVEEVAERWRSPDQGIWEVRGPPQHYVHSKLMAWVALDRAIEITEEIGNPDRTELWHSARDALRKWILTRGVLASKGYFVQRPGSPHVDAANLRIPLVGFLPYEDPRVVATLDAVEAQLTKGPFVWRYRSDDGLEGPEGAFLACSFWRIECLAGVGRSDVAHADWEQLLRVASPLGLYSEQYDPRANEALGNYPQALTHIALLRAALAVGIDLAAPRLREEVAWALTEEGVALHDGKRGVPRGRPTAPSAASGATGGRLTPG